MCKLKQKLHKKDSSFLVIRERKIKITVRYEFTHKKMAKI